MNISRNFLYLEIAGTADETMSGTLTQITESLKLRGLYQRTFFYLLSMIVCNSAFTD